MNSPVFIIGNPRSGTTLLRLMLTCHRNIIIPPECGFAVWLYDTYNDWKNSDDDSLFERFVHDLMKCRKIETWHLDQKGLLGFLRRRRPSSYAEVVSSVYEWYGLSQGRSFKRWGDKNNFYLDHILTIKALFSDVCFVHIIRDGRSVACSYKKLKNRKVDSRYAPRLPDTIEDIAQQWKKNIDTINRSFAAIAWENVYEIRFEDLLQDPPAGLRKLCQQIGEEYDSSMLDYHSINRKHQLEPREFLQWKEKTLMPPIRAEVERYKDELTEAEIRIFEEIAGNELGKYGYLV